MTMLHQLLKVFSVNRGLLLQFTIRNVQIRSRGSHLGLVWSLLNPLLMLALYVLVFGFIFGGRFGVLPNETPVDYGLGIFLGLAIYNFASDVMCSSPMLISDNPNFVKKVVFPLEILPAAQVGAALFHLVITLILVAVGIGCFGRGLNLQALRLILFIPPLVMSGLGIAWFLAAIGVFLQDIRQVLPAAATGLMFASAVFYPVSKIPPAAWQVLRFNPLIHFIENAREAMVWGGDLSIGGMVYVYVTSMIFMVGGFCVFMKLKPAFADVL